MSASALWFFKATLLYASKSARWLNSALTHVLLLWLFLGSSLAYGQNAVKRYRQVWLGLLLWVAVLPAIQAASNCNAVTGIPVSECQSLMALYNNTNGPNWKNHTGWNQTNTPCSWFGVTCGAGHVTKIDLSDDGNTSDNVHGNGLKGQIPNLDLPNLIVLTLWSNQLSGNIPNFSRLPDLESLDLGQNQLTGSIPNFSNIPKLGVLYLDSNQLSGSIPNFSNLPSLEKLYLGGNRLSGNIPNFSNLPKLKSLDFYSNQLRGNIPNFSRLPDLESLDLGQNQLTGSIPNFSNLPKLGSLYLDSNQLSGSIPNFSNLPNLRTLDLGSNAICKDNHVNYSAWQIKATSSDKVTWQEQLNGFPYCSIPDQFCTSGNANVNNVNIGCINGNCSSVGIKITCNSESCQWCDGSDNCGNIRYNDVTQIPGGTISCTNGRCNYNVQSGSGSSSGNFSCKSSGTTTQTAVKVESVNPTVSQSLYQEGDTIKITIPPTAPTGQSQYFGFGLPNDLGLFAVGNLNEFQPFDASNLPEWRGGETAVNTPVTSNLPRGTYNAYLLRSLQGINPFQASANQAALGMTSFVIMDQIKITQITDPKIEIGFIGTTGKETIGVLGKKDKEGRLIDINRIYFGSQTDTHQNLSITLDNNYLPKTMEFPDGSQIEFSNYTNTGATATYRNASGSIINQLDIPLQIDDLYVAAKAIKQFQSSPQPTLNNPVPSVVGNISYPTDSNCLEVMTAVYRGVNALFSGLLQLASVVSCAVATGEAALTGGLAIPLAVWACSSTVLSVADKIAEVATGDKSPFKQLNQANNLVQGVSSCTVMRDVVGCAQFVASEVVDGALDYLKPENVCKNNNNGSCVSSTIFHQWCLHNSGFDFGVGICLADFGTKEKMLEGLKQCEAFSGHGKDEALNRITCEVTLCR